MSFGAAVCFWVFCSTVLIIGTVVWVIQLDRRIRKVERQAPDADG